MKAIDEFGHNNFSDCQEFINLTLIVFSILNTMMNLIMENFKNCENSGHTLALRRKLQVSIVGSLEALSMIQFAKRWWCDLAAL